MQPLQGIEERAKLESIKVQAILKDVSVVSDILTVITTTLSSPDTCIVFGSAFAMEAMDRPFHGLDPQHLVIVRKKHLHVKKT